MTSLDSVLRSRLVARGDAIEAPTVEGLRAVRTLVRRKRRRAAGVAACAAAAVAVTLAWPVSPEAPDPGPPPARDVEEAPRPPKVERSERRGSARDEAGPRGALRPSHPVFGARPAARVAPTRPTDRPGSRSRAVGGSAAAGSAVVPAPEGRTVTAPYEKRTVAGAAMGENAGLGCSDGPGATGAEDCMHFEVGPGETMLDIVLVDGSGQRAWAQVYLYPAGGDTEDLGGVCGRTDAPLRVTPGATVAISIREHRSCPGKTTSGEVHLRFRSG